MITRYECPIGPCPWTTDDAEIAGGGPRYFDSTAAMLADYLQCAEAVIRGHLETHTLLDWATEIQRLHTEHHREEQAALTVTAILLRRLGGSAEVTDAEMAAESGTVHREPGPFSTRLTVTR